MSGVNKQMARQSLSSKTLDEYANYIQEYICNQYCHYIVRKKDMVDIIKEKYGITLTPYNVTIIYSMITYRG